MTRQIGRWLAVSVGLLAMQILVAMAVSPPDLPQVQRSPNEMLAWAFVSSGLVAAILLPLARRSRSRGWPLIAALWVVTFGVGHLGSQIEAVVFHILPLGTGVRLLAGALVVTLAASALVEWSVRGDLVPSDRAGSLEPPPRPALRQFAAVSFLYVGCYFAAGMLAYPFLESFYATRELPSTAIVLPLQLLVRGPLFALILTVLLRLILGTTHARALLAGAALSILGGAAPLIVPNPFFPDPTRWAHFVEVVVSNFVFGYAAARVLSARPVLRSEQVVT